MTSKRPKKGIVKKKPLSKSAFIIERSPHFPTDGLRMGQQVYHERKGFLEIVGFEGESQVKLRACFGLVYTFDIDDVLRWDRSKRPVSPLERIEIQSTRYLENLLGKYDYTN